MKHAKLFFTTVALFVFAVIPLFAETPDKIIYRSGCYGQTFDLWEFTDGSTCQLVLVLADNKSKNVRTFDPALPTIYYIYSPWYTNVAEYSKAIDKCKGFLDFSLLYISLVDLKDSCDLAPCCKSMTYKLDKMKDGTKYIHLAYKCSDLDLLFAIAGRYNQRGREYVLETYVK